MFSMLSALPKATAADKGNTKDYHHQCKLGVCHNFHHKVVTLKGLTAKCLQTKMKLI